VVEHEEGLRERKKRRTRDELEQAALRLFAERGFDAVTVDDISAAAEVSARTFFRHFGSKDDVLISYNRDYLDRLRSRLAERPSGESPLTSVRHAMLAMAADYESEKESLFLRARIMKDTPSLMGRSLEIQQQWEIVLADAVAERLGIPADNDLRPALVAACAVAALRVASDAWLAEDGKSDLPQLVDAALLLVAGGGDTSRWRSGEGLATNIADSAKRPSAN
jgi:AcrR family transcriptional regulator